MNTLLKIVPAALALALSSNIYASDQADLDDIKDWNLVGIEVCLDAALDTIPGDARKVELKMEGDDPFYEFDIEGKDGSNYNVECNAEEGFVVEVEREVSADDAVFKKYAKITEAQARAIALDFMSERNMQNDVKYKNEELLLYIFIFKC
ncbi:MAG: PepSY domain-containing protein [Gammaproteobacteria bacterium]|nr:PepSY domain-containing protein [Gammaproteobacteria bacterium]